MPEPRFDVADIVGGVLADVLRLEVATDPVGLVNLVTNPDGSLGGYGWVAPISGTLVRSATANGPAVEMVTGTATPTYFYTENMAVAAGQYVAAQWDERGATTTGTPYYRVQFEFLDASGAVVGSSTVSGYLLMATTGTRTYGPVLAPAGTTRCRLRFQVYSSNAGANPEANRSWRITNVSVAKAATSAALSTVLTNLITNPSVETNLTGWTTDGVAFPATFARTTGSAYVGAYKLEITKPSGPQASGIWSAPFAVTAGKDYQGRAYIRSGPTAVGGSVSLTWFDASGAVVGTSSTATRISLGATYERVGVTATAPTGAVTARLGIGVVLIDGSAGTIYADAASAFLAPASGDTVPYFDGATADTASEVYDWTGTAHASTSTKSVASVGNLAPLQYVNVMGPTHEIKMNRADLNVGTLTAEVLDATLDPSQASQLRPGRAVRLRALDLTGTWRNLYTGELTSARVTYHLLEDVPDVKRARVSLNAVDKVAPLAAASRPQSVATIAELPYVLEGCGVPWNVNGSGAQVGTATVRATTDAATALDQIAMTRDTAHGYAWVDQDGILQARDATQMPTTNLLTLNEDVYTTADVSFDTDECINEVVVNLRGIDGTGQTVDTVTTYTDAASITQWGRHRSEFTVLKPTNPATFAAEVLAANATPQVRINSVRVNVRDETFLAAGALDLYDRVRLVNTDKGLDHPARIATMEHTITPEAWLIDYGFTAPGSVAAPQVIPPAQSSNPPFTQVGQASFPAQTIPAGAGVFVTVTFPAPYANAPSVMATLNSAPAGTQRLVPRVLSVTATTARIYLYNVGTTDATTTAATTVGWQAYGS